MKLSEYEILRFLKAEGHGLHTDKQTHQHHFMFPLANIEVPIFVKVFDGNILLQIVGYLPFQIAKGSAPTLARALHVFNREMDLPGFGMEEKEGTVFYRLVYPCPSQQIEEDTARLLIGATALAMETFLLTLKAMEEQKITMEQVATQERPLPLTLPTPQRQ